MNLINRFIKNLNESDAKFKTKLEFMQTDFDKEFSSFECTEEEKKVIKNISNAAFNVFAYAIVVLDSLEDALNDK
jgi:sensor histidine kinase YesM